MLRITHVLPSLRAAMLLCVLATPLVAQSGKRPLELRVQLVGVTVAEKVTSGSVSLPGSFAMAWYLGERVALEPRVSLGYASYETPSGETQSGGSLGVGAFLPLYLRADGGRSGLFVAPGISISEPLGDVGGSRAVSGGVDLGLKRRLGERMATRWALELRDRDYDDEITIGGSFGISFFWR